MDFTLNKKLTKVKQKNLQCHASFSPRKRQGIFCFLNNLKIP